MKGSNISVICVTIDDDEDYECQQDPLDLKEEMVDNEDTDYKDILSFSKDQDDKDPLDIEEELKVEEDKVTVGFSAVKECLKEELPTQDSSEEFRDDICRF